jgi:hypothetical protein
MYYNGIQTNVEVQLSYVSTKYHLLSTAEILSISIICQVWGIGIQTEARMTVQRDAGFHHFRQSHLRRDERHQSHLHRDERHQNHLMALFLWNPRKSTSVTEEYK